MHFPLITEDFLKTVGKRIRAPKSGDRVDTLHCRYTVILLLFMLIWVYIHLSKEPLLCWLPLELTNVQDWKRFVYDFCFVQGTYYLQRDEVFPREVASERRIGYYQWVPVILATQAFAFYLPHYIWKCICSHHGLNVETILAEARKVADATKNRDKELQRFAELFQELLLQQNDFRVFRSIGSKIRGSYLTLAYLFIKVLQCTVVIGQFLLLSVFFGSNYPMWGYDVLSDLFHGREWQESGSFPRVAFCEYPAPDTGKVHIRTAQCLLKINLLNEKIFLFLWCWFLFLSVVTCLNFLSWLYTGCSTYQWCKSVRQYLRIRKLVTGRGFEPRIRPFVANNLGADGMIMVSFISSQIGDLVASHVVAHLWVTWVNGVATNNNGKIVADKMRATARVEDCEAGLIITNLDKNIDATLMESPADESADPKSKRKQKSEAWRKKQAEVEASQNC